jgi:hypothetical protein
MLLNVNEKFGLGNLKASLLKTFVFNQLSLSVNAIEEATYPMVPCGYDEVKISVINSRNIYL